jgi:hypothetical protein
MSKPKPKNQSNGRSRRIKRGSPVHEVPEGVSPGFGSRRLELLRLERKLFSKAGKEKRAERAVQAVREFCGSFASKVDLETVKWIAQDGDILDV